MTGYQGLVTLGLLGMTLGLLGCDDGGMGGSGQCGGSFDSDACVRIDKIEPVFGSQATPSSNVDALQDTCPSGDPEPFTDHNAMITISNSRLPGVGPVAATTVTLQNFSIRYLLNDCPAGATCPVLDSLTFAPGQTVTIQPNSSVTLTLPFVPLAKKFEYVTRGGALLAFPSYTARYSVTGTDTFHHTVSAQGAAQFTIGDFDLCPR